MGTISNLSDWSKRRRDVAGLAPIAVSLHGFATGDMHVAWQAVSEIRAARTDPASGGESLVEFVAAGTCVVVSDRQPGFDKLEKAMSAVFPATASWREMLQRGLPPGERATLYRREPDMS